MADKPVAKQDLVQSILELRSEAERRLQRNKYYLAIKKLDELLEAIQPLEAEVIEEGPRLNPVALGSLRAEEKTAQPTKRPEPEPTPPPRRPQQTATSMPKTAAPPTAPFMPERVFDLDPSALKPVQRPPARARPTLSQNASTPRQPAEPKRFQAQPPPFEQAQSAPPVTPVAQPVRDDGLTYSTATAPSVTQPAPHYTGEALQTRLEAVAPQTRSEGIAPQARSEGAEPVHELTDADFSDEDDEQPRQNTAR